jgi:hypothetical protein
MAILERFIQFLVVSNHEIHAHSSDVYRISFDNHLRSKYRTIHKTINIDKQYQ